MTTEPPEAADEPAIVARGLTKRFGDFEAVKGIDFTVRRGECFGFLGPNGAGKTTTMRMLYRATPKGDGDLTILGLPVASGQNDRVIKRRIGVIPQEDSLDQELSVRENLIVFCRFHGLKGAAAVARAEELIAFVDLEAKADAPVITLSGGMKRRALIARGLVGSPDLVILDEPTTGLDPQARHALWDRLNELRQRNATLVLTTHYMDEAEQLCDRLVVMNEGRIVAEGAPRDLIDEHVPPHVVEVRLDGGALPPEAEALREAAVRSDITGDRLMLYTDDAEATVAAAAHALPNLRTLVRRSTLEDVFLKITGRGLGT